MTLIPTRWYKICGETIVVEREKAVCLGEWVSGVNLNSLLIVSQRNSVGVNVEGWGETGRMWE